MKNAILAGSIIGLAIAAGIATVGTQSLGATDVYKFLVRGIVTEVTASANSVTMYSTHTSDLAKNDLGGVVQDFNVKTTKFYKWVGGKKVRVKIGSVKVGDEVVMRGVKKSNGQFNVTKLTVNDRSFSIVGKLKEIDTTNRKLTILVGTSTYKQKTYVDKEVVMTYDDNTEFKSLGSLINFDELVANNQKVKVIGAIVNDGQWEVTNLWNNVK
jgi:hypothetical protein